MQDIPTVEPQASPDQSAPRLDGAESPTFPRRAWRWLAGEDRVRAATVAPWVALALVWLVVVVLLVRWDFREIPRAGDENNWIMQSLSLAYGQNLSYDAVDIYRWEQLDLDRTPNPQGIFFRVNNDSYTVAKPYAYSLVLAPFVRVFGAPTGIALGNTVLLTALVAIAIAILRTRLAGPSVPLLAGVFVFASYAYFYAFTTAVDLFLAVVTAVACLGFVRAWTHRNPWWAALGAFATAVALADRVPVGLAFLPAAAIVLVRLPDLRHRLAFAAVGIVSYALAVFPFLYYSDFNAVSPYAAPRFHTSSSGVPWTIPASDWLATKSPDAGHPDSPSHFSPSGIWSRITRSPGDVPEATAYFLVGRHTGLLVFMPLAFITFVLAVVWWRRLDAIGWALLAGVIGYSLLYLVVYTTNYYGGGHSLGNRYFLQVSPLMLGVLTVLRPSTRASVALATTCVVLTLVFLWPHHAEPETAYLHIDRTSAPQRLMPFEHNQRNERYFRCAPGYGWAPPCMRAARG